MQMGSTTTRTRFWLYWILSIGITIVFSLFTATMLMVPGVAAESKIRTLSVIATIMITALGIGTWRFSSTEAPAMIWPLGPAIGVVLSLELIWCLIGIFQVATHSKY